MIILQSSKRKKELTSIRLFPQIRISNKEMERKVYLRCVFILLCLFDTYSYLSSHKSFRNPISHRISSSLEAMPSSRTTSATSTDIPYSKPDSIVKSNSNGQIFVCTNKWCREKGSDATMAAFTFLTPEVGSFEHIQSLTMFYTVTTTD